MMEYDTINPEKKGPFTTVGNYNILIINLKRCSCKKPSQDSVHAIVEIQDVQAVSRTPLPPIITPPNPDTHPEALLCSDLYYWQKKKLRIKYQYQAGK